jgi:nitroimidazol reductase NimA-like FMN-containing flavoprotein (pyridoxamine 5'-phosphate oxidase superfamily)
MSRIRRISAPKGIHVPTKLSTTYAEPVASRPHMPGYGLPAGSAELMPWSWAEQRLESSHNYWLATVRQDGRPHLMIVWGLWLGGVFYFSTGSRSRKALNLESNDQCVIGTEHAHEAVVVEGVAEKLRDVEQLEEMLSLYQLKYDYDMSAMREDILALREPIFAVRPSVAFGLEEKVGLQNATRWRFAT